MSAHVEQQDIQTAIKALTDVISGHMAKPLYLRFEMQEGHLTVEQVEYLTTEEAAAMAKVDVRTLYTWFDKGLLPFCRPDGTNNKLVPLKKFLHWLESSETVTKPKPKDDEVE